MSWGLWFYASNNIPSPSQASCLYHWEDNWISHVTQVMQALQQEFGLPLRISNTLFEKLFLHLVNIELTPVIASAILKPSWASFDSETHKETNIYYGPKRQDQVPLPDWWILASGSFCHHPPTSAPKGNSDSSWSSTLAEDRNFCDLGSKSGFRSDLNWWQFFCYRFWLLLLVIPKQILLRKTRRTEAVQESSCALIWLRPYQDTELGRKYGLSEIKKNHGAISRTDSDPVSAAVVH